MSGAGFSEQRSEHKRPFIKCDNEAIEDRIDISPYSGFVTYIMEVRIAFRDKFVVPLIVIFEGGIEDSECLCNYN